MEMKKINFLSSSSFLILVFTFIYFSTFLSCYAYAILDETALSMHLWRQCDAYSITLNYFKEGTSFLEPKIHMMTSTKGRADGEFPLFYYINTQIWNLTGVNSLLPRLINIFYCFGGLLCLFLFCLNIYKNRILAFTTPLVILFCPLFIFYTNSFMLNTCAL